MKTLQCYIVLEKNGLGGCPASTAWTSIKDRRAGGFLGFLPWLVSH